jgi:hypothetical protein
MAWLKVVTLLFCVANVVFFFVMSWKVRILHRHARTHLEECDVLLRQTWLYLTPEERAAVRVTHPEIAARMECH